MTEFDPSTGTKAALLNGLPRAAIRGRHQGGAGRELVSGKFANSESSAASAARFKVGPK